MSEVIRVIIPKDGLVTIGAFCLKTDSWHDYLAFKEDIKLAAATGDTRKVNRYLRAALTSLFSHFEAVVLDIQIKHPKLNPGRLRLSDRTKIITNEAKKYKRGIPHLDFRLGKHLRDLIAHPGIEIDFMGSRPRKLNIVSVFDDLDLNTLEELERRFSGWLDAVCEALKVNRLTDTKELVESLSSHFGTSNEIQEI